MEFLLDDKIRIAVFCKAKLIRLLHKRKEYQITKGTQRLLLTGSKNPWTVRPQMGPRITHTWMKRRRCSRMKGHKLKLKVIKGWFTIIT